MSRLIPINPQALGQPRGYSNGMLAPVASRLLFVAGQIAWNQDQKLVSDRFPDQFRQALANVLAVVRETGGEASDLAQLTIYVVDRAEYLASLKEVGACYRELMGKHFPTMALVEVQALLEPGAKVEIQALAAIGQGQDAAGENDHGD